MNREEKRGIFFEESILAELRKKFYNVDTDADGTDRIFFENAGGSLRLKAAVEIADYLNRFPDCYAREHKSSKVLQQYERQGKEDLRLLLNASGGTIATNLTASALMFDMVEPIVEHGKGTNIVTTVLEHPSAYDACRYFAEKYGKEVRVTGSNKRTGGIDAEAVLKLVDENTLLVNVTSASNMTGAITDLKTIAEGARKKNPEVYILSDAVQHAPHALIDVDGIGLDGVNIAPYKFFGNRGISFGYVSDRVKDLPHRRILDDDPDVWELGSLAPAHYGAISAVVDYIAWVGAHYTSSGEKHTQMVEGMRRIRLHEQALLHRMLHGTEDVKGLLDMDEVDCFFDYTDLQMRDLILPMKIKGMDYYDAVREYEKRGIIVFERVAASAFSRRMIESFGLDGIIRVSPLHCNSPEEVDRFLKATDELIALMK